MITNKKQSIIKPDKISIDTLGEMIQNWFVEADKRIDSLETKINKKIDDFEQKVDYRFNGLTRQIDNIYLNYTTMNEHSLLKDRVRKVERKVGIKIL